MNEKTILNSQRWKNKREKILKRDNYICQICKMYGKTTQAKIVHHIKSFDDYPDLAFDDNNLLSLCEKCHNKIHPEKAIKKNMLSKKY